jgi:hypothetical protein
LAVKVDDVATPVELDTAVDVRVEVLAKVPEAPLAGAVKVTVAPLTGLLNWSVTVATSGLAKAEATVALWGLPDVTVIVFAAPEVFVSTKLTVPEPEVEADTL